MAKVVTKIKGKLESSLEINDLQTIYFSGNMPAFGLLS
jgi:hypothetical protein